MMDLGRSNPIAFITESRVAVDIENVQKLATCDVIQSDSRVSPTPSRLSWSGITRLSPQITQF